MDRRGCQAALGSGFSQQRPGGRQAQPRLVHPKLAMSLHQTPAQPQLEAAPSAGNQPLINMQRHLHQGPGWWAALGNGNQAWLKHPRHTFTYPLSRLIGQWQRGRPAAVPLCTQLAALLLSQVCSCCMGHRLTPQRPCPCKVCRRLRLLRLGSEEVLAVQAQLTALMVRMGLSGLPADMAAVT